MDAKGCQALPEGKGARILKGVTFESGKSELTAEAQNVLLGVAQLLVANADVRVEVQGHTDNTGSRALNTRLSKARAEALNSTLRSAGCDRAHTVLVRAALYMSPSRRRRRREVLP